MKKILLVTDAWAPQINGVTRVLNAHIDGLKKRDYEVFVIEPNQFRTMPLPMYLWQLILLPILSSIILCLQLLALSSRRLELCRM